MSGHQRPPVQAPRHGEVELLRAAADFEKDGPQGIQARRLLGDPQRIGELRCLGDQQILRANPKALGKSRCIGPAGLAKDFRRPDPQQRARRFGLRQHAKQRQRKTSRRAGIACRDAMDFRQASSRSTNAKRIVKALHTTPQQKSAARRHRRQALCSRLVRRIEPFGQPAFDLRDLLAQGANNIPRHGGVRHDGRFPRKLFLLCSYRFQNPPGESSDPEKEFIPPGTP